ncbi:CD225/dispanin family protein [Mycobacterium sp. HUMS_1102779]|uniref:CD225/dispanin family protein n=1 Tax=Mycobacterium sp. HUMS_1102779 TaxID=3383487 RepID=UPI00389A0681
MSYPPGSYGGSPGWQGWPAPREPDNYLLWAVLCAVLCCLPLGIVSIVYSSKVSGLWAQGRFAEAQTAAADAKRWAVIGAIAAASFYLIIGVLYLVILTVAVTEMPRTPAATTLPGY